MISDQGDQGKTRRGVEALPGHRNIGRGSCRSAGADGVGTPVYSSGTGGSEALLAAAQWTPPPGQSSPPPIRLLFGVGILFTSKQARKDTRARPKNGRGSPREHLAPRPAFFRAAIAIGRLAEGFAQRSSLRRVRERERERCRRLNGRPVRVAWGLQHRSGGAPIAATKLRRPDGRPPSAR